MRENDYDRLVRNVLDNIKDTIYDRGLTIEEVAKRINVSRSCLSGRLNANHLVLDDVFFSVLQVLKLDLRILVS